MILKPSWRSWLARQSHNLKVVSSSLTEGILLCTEIFGPKSFSVFGSLSHKEQRCQVFRERWTTVCYHEIYKLINPWQTTPQTNSIQRIVLRVPAKDTVVKLRRIRMSKALCYFLSWKWIIDYIPLLTYRYCLYIHAYVF